MTTSLSRIKVKMRESPFWNTKKPEGLTVLIFLVLYCIVTAFHEPWFDEAQSWQIAKCENIARLIFYIPHYEGNPPLWYLILAIPAKLGVPFEIGLKTVGLLISLCSISLVVFKSPFPRVVKLILPFTYFFSINTESLYVPMG